jgi:hypothetical protein
MKPRGFSQDRISVRRDCAIIRPRVFASGGRIMYYLDYVKEKYLGSQPTERCLTEK